MKNATNEEKSRKMKKTHAKSPEVFVFARMTHLNDEATVLCQHHLAENAYSCGSFVFELIQTVIFVI